MPTTETNDRGNKVTREFCPASRYTYDFGACSPERGWKQYDTDQDAPYFGVWVHVADRKVFTYCEGDCILVECPTPEGFKAELDSMEAFYGSPPPAAIVIGANGTVTHVFDERPKAEG